MANRACSDAHAHIRRVLSDIFFSLILAWSGWAQKSCCNTRRLTNTRNAIPSLEESKGRTRHVSHDAHAWLDDQHIARPRTICCSLAGI